MIVLILNHTYIKYPLYKMEAVTFYNIVYDNVMAAKLHALY